MSIIHVVGPNQAHFRGKEVPFWAPTITERHSLINSKSASQLRAAYKHLCLPNLSVVRLHTLRQMIKDFQDRPSIQRNHWYRLEEKENLNSLAHLLARRLNRPLQRQSPKKTREILNSLDSQWTFPFLRLPAELRNKIYYELFAPRDRWNDGNTDRPALETNILLTNKFVYSESLAVLRQLNNLNVCITVTLWTNDNPNANLYVNVYDDDSNAVENREITAMRENLPGFRQLLDMDCWTGDIINLAQCSATNITLKLRIYIDRPGMSLVLPGELWRNEFLDAVYSIGATLAAKSGPINLRLIVDLETSDSQHHTFEETEAQEESIRRCARSAIEVLKSYKANVQLLDIADQGLVSL
jgi:hypothetical protein